MFFLLFYIHFHISWFDSQACFWIECVMFPLLSACIYCTTKNTYRNTNTTKNVSRKMSLFNITHSTPRHM